MYFAYLQPRKNTSIKKTQFQLGLNKKRLNTKTIVDKINFLRLKNFNFQLSWNENRKNSTN